MARKQKKIRVVRGGGSELVPGQLVGKTWAVTQSQVSGNYWDVTHAPTGHRVLGPGPKAPLTAFARRLVELRKDSTMDSDRYAAAGKLIQNGVRDLTEQAQKILKGRGTRAQMAAAMRKLKPRRGYSTAGATPVEETGEETRARLRKDYGTPQAGYPYVLENAIARIAAEVDLHQLQRKEKAGLRLTNREIELLDNLDAAVHDLQEKVDVWFAEMEVAWGAELVHPMRVQLERDLEEPRLARARGLWDGQGLLPGIPVPPRG